MPYHHRYILPLLCAAAALGAALAPAPSSGQNAQPSPALTGTWQLEGSVQQAQQTVQQAVNPAVARLTPDIQRLARARIAESTWVPRTITIQAAPDRILVELQGTQSRSFDTPPGQPQNVFSPSGVRAQLTQTYRPDGGIQQQLRAMDGTQYNFLVPQDDGQHLDLDVLMQSPRLQGDIRFQLRYRKAG